MVRGMTGHISASRFLLVYADKSVRKEESLEPGFLGSHTFLV